MIRTKIKIGKDLLNIVELTKAKAAMLIATKVKAEFNTLLMETPQYSGNYVSNMRISVGDSKRSSEATRVYKAKPKKLKAAGTMAPINRARKANDLDTFEERFASHALGLPWFGPTMTVYNNLREAKYIEGMEESRLRDPNKIGFSAMERFKRRVDDIDILIKVK